MKNGNATVGRNPDVVAERVAEKNVIIDVMTGDLGSLNESARLIWEVLTEPMSITAICKHLAEYYGVNALEISEDVESFVDDMVSHGYLVYD